jgi:phosphoribosylformylglycinamidine synthase subunit PurSL
MKNDFHGVQNGRTVQISVPPTLLMTAIGRVSDVNRARTADFKSAGDVIYLLGCSDFGLRGSEWEAMSGKKGGRTGVPSWSVARKIYNWIGGGHGKLQSCIKSLHDVSEGGMLVAISESLMARGLGAILQFPKNRSFWEFSFGEGFHSFVTSLSQEDAPLVEVEWNQLNVPFIRLGSLNTTDRLKIFLSQGDQEVETAPILDIGISEIRRAWLKEGYWE